MRLDITRIIKAVETVIIRYNTLLKENDFDILLNGLISCGFNNKLPRKKLVTPGYETRAW